MNAKVLGIFVLLVALCAFLSFYTPDSFLKGNNIENLIRRTSMYGILGIGVAFVIITGGIDLSIGSLVCLSGCLLALFLGVDYVPFQGSDISRAVAANNSLLIKNDSSAGKTGSPYVVGDRLRFYGSKRARNEVMKIEQVQESDAGLELVVTPGPSRDASSGRVAVMIAVKGFDEGDLNASPPVLPTVTLEGTHSELAARDQIWFVAAGENATGLKQLTMVEVEVTEDETRLTLDDSLGSFDQTWMAVPLERQQRFSIPIALLMVLGIALGLGALHGLLVTQLRLQPFVVTLCGLLFYRGIARWIVDDSTMGFGDEYESNLSLLGTGKLPIWEAADGSDSFGIPFPFFVMLACAIAAAVLLNMTIWGRYMLALGRNEDAARYSGINTKRMTLIAYVISAVMAAVGGILFSLDSNSVAPSSFGNFFELYAIAAAVLGGCSLRGGEGGILGVVVGTALMQTLYNLIVLVKISDKLEFAIIGAVILIGVIADELVKRFAARRRAIAKAR